MPLPWLSYIYWLIHFKAEICSACKCNCLQTWLSVYTSAVLKYCMGISLSIRPVDQQQRQLAVSFYCRWCYVGSGVVVSARRVGSAMNRFYTKQTKIFGPENICICFFLKVSEKLFVAQKINLKETLIFGGEYSIFPNPYLGRRIWNWNTKNKNQKLKFSSFICLS